jgi:hypothetical protein
VDIFGHREKYFALSCIFFPISTQVRNMSKMVKSQSVFWGYFDMIESCRDFPEQIESLVTEQLK